MFLKLNLPFCDLNRTFLKAMKSQTKSKYFTQKNQTNKSSEVVHSKSKTDEFLENETSNKEPLNWKDIYHNIDKMRSKTVADVDTMGCEKSFDVKTDAKTRRFQILVSLMLSSQTKDTVNYAAMGRLKERNLNINMIENISATELENLIKPVGFYRRKTEYLKKVAQILIDQYNGDIPCTFEELIKLPGVGPKMAHLVMLIAWNQVTGIAIDTHMHRICNRLNWVKSKTPEQTRAQLEGWLPKEYWSNVNHLLVGFGQSICRPIKPKCNECLNKKICPSSTFEF